MKLPEDYVEEKSKTPSESLVMVLKQPERNPCCTANEELLKILRSWKNDCKPWKKGMLSVGSIVFQFKLIETDRRMQNVLIPFLKNKVLNEVKNLR